MKVINVIALPITYPCALEPFYVMPFAGWRA